METSWEHVEKILTQTRPYIRYMLIPIGVYAIKRLVTALVPGPQHQSKLDVRDRTVLITGASSGLGRELAIKFYKEGARVILTARSIDKLKELCDELMAMEGISNPNKPAYKYLDICDTNGFEEILALSPNGKIDVLVNNAGLSMRGSCRDTSLKVQRQIMEVNFFGHVAITQAFLDVIPDDGAIIVTSSVQGRIAVPYRSAYSASKHAAQAFFDCLRCEDRPDLQILVVNAGYMNTDFGRRALDIQGEPVNRADENQAKGINPDKAADLIYQALVNRQTELIMAPFIHRTAIFLRWFWPNLFFYVMYRRGQKDAHPKHE